MEISEVCPKCKNMRWVSFIDSFGYEISRRCECYAAVRAKELMSCSDIPSAFMRKNFDSFNHWGNPALENAKLVAKRYAKSFSENEGETGNSILFCGQPGSGKTHLGMAISNQLLSECVGVAYMAYRNEITRIKQAITSEHDYDELLGRYKRARVLFVDDLLKGKVTEADLNILYDLVNHRYMNKLAMIVSTEKSPEELLDIDEAIFSRLIEMCGGNVVHLRGKELNYRMKK